MPRKKKSEQDNYSMIPQWPEHERPRERLLKYGTESLSDAELFIRTGMRKRTAVDLAQTLLSTFESLRNLGSLSIADLRQRQKELGLGVAKAASIVAAFELGHRAASSHASKKTPVRSPEEIAKQYMPLLRELKKEQFRMVLLDSANQILRDTKISDGILNSSLVHPREDFKPVIVESAAAIILLHNHPSSNPEPSSEDLQMTRQLVDASKIIGIPIQNYIIVAENPYTSFAERGLI